MLQIYEPDAHALNLVGKFQPQVFWKVWCLLLAVEHLLFAMTCHVTCHVGQERLGPVLLAASEVKAGAWVVKFWSCMASHCQSYSQRSLLTPAWFQILVSDKASKPNNRDRATHLRLPKCSLWQSREIRFWGQTVFHRATKRRWTQMLLCCVFGWPPLTIIAFYPIVLLIVVPTTVEYEVQQIRSKTMCITMPASEEAIRERHVVYSFPNGSPWPAIKDFAMSITQHDFIHVSRELIASATTSGNYDGNYLFQAMTFCSISGWKSKGKYNVNFVCVCIYIYHMYIYIYCNYVYIYIIHIVICMYVYLFACLFSYLFIHLLVYLSIHLHVQANVKVLSWC